MEYPTVPDFVRLNKREQVRLDRRRSAWNLVHHKFGEVTDDEYERAYKLLDRCIRYALANYHHNETETEFNVNNPRRKHKEQLLWNRFVRLNGELAYYDARLSGEMWPQVLDKDKTVGCVVCRLYDFD